MITRASGLIAVLAALLATVLVFSSALADGAKGVAVNPLTPKPGDEITVKGEMLGENSTVEVRLVGNGQDVDLGEVQANDEGDFTAKFTLPSDLPKGRYQVTAKGAESAATEITLTAAGGEASKMSTDAAVPVRDRPLEQNVLLAAVFGVLAGLGLFFALTANRAARVSR